MNDLKEVHGEVMFVGDRHKALREVIDSRYIFIIERTNGGYLVEFNDFDNSVAEWGAGQTRSEAMAYALGAYYA